MFFYLILYDFFMIVYCFYMNLYCFYEGAYIELYTTCPASRLGKLKNWEKMHSYRLGIRKGLDFLLGLSTSAPAVLPALATAGGASTAAEAAARP